MSDAPQEEELDFLPLTVDYQGMTFAAGKIPGGFFKREGRPNEREILICRIIGRSIRPLFPRATNTKRDAADRHGALRGRTPARLGH